MKTMLEMVQILRVTPSDKIMLITIIVSIVVWALLCVQELFQKGTAWILFFVCMDISKYYIGYPI